MRARNKEAGSYLIANDISGELSDGELVVRHVVVERFDDPVAKTPRTESFGVDLEPIRFTESN